MTRMSHRQGRRRLPSEAAGPMLERLAANLEAQKLGRRQQRILDALRRMEPARSRDGASVAAIAAEVDARIYDVYGSLLGLQARGLAVATTRQRTLMGMRSDGWVLTDSGRRT